PRPLANSFQDGRGLTEGKVLRAENGNARDTRPISSHQPSQDGVGDVTHCHHCNRNVTRHGIGKDAALADWPRLAEEVLHERTTAQMTNRGARLVENVL